MSDHVETILNEYSGAGQDQLIPILQKVQDQEGYLSKESMSRIGDHLHVPVSHVYGVATFYNQFRFQPMGRFPVTVCRGTACHVKNSITVLEALTRELGIQPGETTEDGLFSLEIVACIGACGLAPVIKIGEHFHAKAEPKKIKGILNKYRKEASDA